MTCDDAHKISVSSVAMFVNLTISPDLPERQA